MVLLSNNGALHDDVTLKQIMVIEHIRYAVLEDDEGITFVKVTIDENGNTLLTDISDDSEFNNVYNFYHKNPLDH